MYNNFKLFSLFCLAGLTLCTSCDKEDKLDPEDQNGEKGYVAPSEWAQGSSRKYVENPNELQTVRVQQYQLEGTGIALANHHKSVNFKEVIDLARHANDNYLNKEGYKDDVVSDFFDVTWDLLVKDNPDPVKWNTYSNTYAYKLSDYDNIFNTGSDNDKDKYVVSSHEEKVNAYFIQLFQASKFYAHFQAGENGWIQEPGEFNDLQFYFKDQNGKPCTLTANVSGNEQVVYFTQESDNWEAFDTSVDWVEKDTTLMIESWDYEIGERIITPVKVNGYRQFSYVETYDVKDIKVSVPEHVNITLKQDGKTLVSTEFNFNLSGIENERININKTALSFTSKTKVGPTEFVINKFDYKNASKSDYSIFSTINSKKLYEISGEFLSDVNYKGNQNYQYLDELMGDFADDYQSSINKFTGVVANVNILNEVQVKAAISDGKKFIELLDEAYDHDRQELYFKNAIDEANKYINLGLYYYGGSKLQAKVRLEPFEKEEIDEMWVSSDGEYGYTVVRYWYVEPVIEFEGGQTYSMEEFFNEDDFRSLVDLIKEIGDDYEDQLDF